LGELEEAMIRGREYSIEALGRPWMQGRCCEVVDGKFKFSQDPQSGHLAFCGEIFELG